MGQPNSSTSEYSLIVGIVGHTKRQQTAEDLAFTVEAEDVWIDEGYHGEWKNHLRAWEHAAQSDATHALILQDDAVPVGNLRKHVLDGIAEKPDEMISLYTGTYRPRKSEVVDAVKRANRFGASWLTADTLMWGVAVVLPVARIEEMLEVAATMRIPYDQRLGSWAEQAYRTVYYTWPSLVDHADTETVAHAGKGEQGLRVAHRTGVPMWNCVEAAIKKPYEDMFLGSKGDQ